MNELESKTADTDTDVRLTAPKNDWAALFIFTALLVLATFLVPRLGLAQEELAVSAEHRLVHDH